MSLASIGVDILPREAGEGDHAQRGGGGSRRFDPTAFAGLQNATEAAAAPSTAFGGRPPSLCGGRFAPGVRLVRDLALYGLGSAVALGADWAVLVVLVRHGIDPLVAAAVSFSLGMAVTYTASVTLVFADRRSRSRIYEALVFVVIGIAGLGLNELCLWMLAHDLGLAAPVAKAPTAVVVFLFNFTVRRAMLFVGAPS